MVTHLDKFAFGILLCICNLSALHAEDWRHWRGPSATGETKTDSAPLSWSDTQNVVWKVGVPGKGHSTPIAVGELVVVTTAVAVGEKLPPRLSGRPGAHDNAAVDSRYDFLVIAYDRVTGSERWRKTVNNTLPREGGHSTASLASHSPVADDKVVVASFGSHGIYCFDHSGKILWEKQLGQMHSKHGHGEGSSPVLFEDLVAINWDHEEQSFVVVLDKLTGEEVWRRDRDEVTSWSSPIVVTIDDRPQLVVCGTSRVRGYDLKSGDVVWECGGMSGNVVASPVFANGLLYVGSSYEKRILMAIDITAAEGDVTGSEHVKWSTTRGTPYVPSLLLANQGLYYLAHYQNILTRVDATTGEPAPGPMRLGDLGNIYASPVATEKAVYITDLEGVTMVLSSGDKPELLSVNQLGEPVAASLAIADGSIFIRGEQHLFRVSSAN